MDNDKFRLTLFDKPNAITFNIGKPVSEFEFLVASKWEIRHTMAEVGYIKLYYADGSSQTEPLVNGRNIGSVYDPLTTEAVDVDLMK
ncbi:MAG: hypothetical protein ABFD54_17380 [Armatimonadota bacterium]